MIPKLKMYWDKGRVDSEFLTEIKKADPEGYMQPRSAWIHEMKIVFAMTYWGWLVGKNISIYSR